MSVQNTLAMLNLYRQKNVHAVRTPAGIVIMGARNLKPAEKKVLLEIPQGELDAALRWQQ